MNRKFFVGILFIGLLLSACGSDTAEVTSVSDVDSLVETKVASTVAATVGDNEPVVAVEPTLPDISGDATPLTPIPQYEEPSIEVSPEIEYLPEGREDAPVTFDFGEGIMATSAAAVTPTIAPEPTRAKTAVIGGTIFIPGSLGDDTLAVTLNEAGFVASFVNSQGVERLAPEGFRYLKLDLQAQHAYPTPISAQSLEGSVKVHSEYNLLNIHDRDNDAFPCQYLTTLDNLELRGLYLPGYGFEFDLVCEIPVTVAADELDGLRLVGSGSGTHAFEFDLGRSGGVPADLSEIEVALSVYTLPVSSDDICGIKSETPYIIDAAKWYAAPAASPEDYQLEQVVKLYLDDERNNRQYGFIPNAGGFEDADDAANELVNYWSTIWEGYDFEAHDLVAIRIKQSNASKASVAPIDYSSFALIDPDRFRSAKSLDTFYNSASFVNPLDFLNRALPPGSEQFYTLYAVVPEASDKIALLHRTTCLIETVSNPWVIVEIPRMEYAQQGVSQPVSDELIEVVVAATLSATTNIEVEERQEVTIEYVSGQWRPGLTADWPLVGPEGDDRVPGKASFPLPDAPLMALIFGIEGADEVYQFKGPEMIFTAPSSGVLWFGPNDDNLSDNAGELLITITTK